MKPIEQVRLWSRLIMLMTLMALMAATGLASASVARASLTSPVLTVTMAGDGSGTVTSSDGQITCSSGSCSTTYQTAGATVTLTASPAQGSGFDGFTGCTLNPGTNSCTVVMTQDQTITATFALPPTASISSPADGTYYTTASVPAAAYSCQPDPYSALQDCAGTADAGTASAAPVSSGAPMPATIGSHTLTVEASDTDSQTESASATYHVADPPSASFTAPADPQPFAVGSHEVVSFTCLDGTGGTAISSCQDSAGDAGSADRGSGSTGQSTLETSAPGTYQITLTPRSSDGLSGPEATYAYTVAGPPTVSIVSPATGDPDYAAGSVPAADFSCAPGPDGSTPTCTATADASSIDSGGALPSSPGAHSMTVTATADGQTTTATRTYTVSSAPTAAIQVPSGNDPTYVTGAVPDAAFTCTPDPNSPSDPGLQGCSGSVDNGPAMASGAQLPGSVGSHTLVVTATDQDGQTATATARFEVVAPGAPVVTVTTPPAGDPDYPAGSVPAAEFSCAAGTNGSAPTCDGTADGAAIMSGQALPASPGPHSLTVTATADGQTTTVTNDYTVSGPPTLAVAAPADTTYASGQVPSSDFTCTAGRQTTLKTCSAAADGGASAPTGTALPSSPGSHTLVVTAADADGQSVSDTIKYTVAPASPTPQATSSATSASSSSSTTAPSSSPPKFIFVAPPSIDARRPIQGAVYTLGEKVIVVYSCSDAAGPGLQSCSGTVGSGRRLDTSRLGTHTFTVTGADTGGESSSETITYRVVPTTNRFKIRRVRVTRSGVARSMLALPGPGRLVLVGRAWSTTGRRFVYTRRQLRVRRAGALTAAAAPNATGRRLLRLGAVLRGRLTITYTPTGGRPRTLQVRSIRF